MKQEYLQKIFDENKVLDDKFGTIYKDVDNLVDCNKIELMAELMELANSSRVFKYWKKKPMDYEETLYEYVDWLVMLFFFFHINDEKIKLIKVDEDIDTVSLILELIDLYNRFINGNENILNEILSKYVLLWEKIWFNKEDVLHAALDKIQKTALYLNWVN